MDDKIIEEHVAHFYYCLLVSIKLRKKAYPGTSEAETRRFVKRWLQTAQEKKLFHSCIANDAKWLSQESDRHNLGLFEARIARIYTLLIETQRMAPNTCEIPEQEKITA